MPANPFVIFIILTMFLGQSPLSLAETISGEEVYVKNCMVCHGDDGSGAMPGVSDLANNNSFFASDNKTLINIIINGVEKPGATVVMPPKGGNPELSYNQIKTVVFYLRQLVKKGN